MASKSDRNIRMSIFLNDKTGGKTLRELRTEARKLRNEIAGLKPGTQAFIDKTKQLREVDGRIKKINKSLRSQQGLWGKVGNVLKSSLGGFFAITTAIVAVGRGFKNLITNIAEFEDSAADLSAITGLVNEDLKDMKQAALDMQIELDNAGVNMKKSGSQVLEAFKLVASAKPELLQNKEALNEMTKASIILSEASRDELSVSVKNLTGLMNQYNAGVDQSEKYINALAAGAKYGAGEISYVTDAVLRFGTAASAANIPIEKSVALTELFAEKGLKSEKAGTAMRNILIELQKDTKNYTNGQFDFNKALDNLRPIQNDVIALTDKFGKENVIASQILAQNKIRLDELTESITGSNAAYEQAVTNTDTLKSAWGNLKVSWKNLVTSTADGEGIFSKLLKNIVKGLDWIVDKLYVGKVQVVNFFRNAYNESLPFRASIEILKGGFKTLFATIKLVFKSIVNVFKTPAKLMKGLIEGGFQGLKDAAKEVGQDWKKIGNEWGDKTVTGFKEAFQKITDNEKKELLSIQPIVEEIDNVIDTRIRAHKLLSELEKANISAGVNAVLQAEKDKMKAVLETNKVILEQAKLLNLDMEKINRDFRIQISKEEGAFKSERIKEFEDYIAVQMQLTDAASSFFADLKDRELRIAGDNEEKKKEIHKKYADIEFAITVARIIASTAAAVAKVWEQTGIAGTIAQVAPIVMGATQLASAAMAREQVKGYYYGGERGGYTGNGNPTDVAGYFSDGSPYHKQEYIIPSFLRHIPQVQMAENMIESMRVKQLGGYFEGGNRVDKVNSESIDFKILVSAINRLNYNLENPHPSLAVFDQDVVNKIRTEIKDQEATENISLV